MRDMGTVFFWRMIDPWEVNTEGLGINRMEEICLCRFPGFLSLSKCQKPSHLHIWEPSQIYYILNNPNPIERDPERHWEVPLQDLVAVCKPSASWNGWYQKWPLISRKTLALSHRGMVLWGLLDRYLEKVQCTWYLPKWYPEKAAVGSWIKGEAWS